MSKSFGNNNMRISLGVRYLGYDVNRQVSNSNAEVELGW